MGLIPVGKSWEEIDREAIEEALSQRTNESDVPFCSADRVHQFLVDLEQRFNEVGSADPTIIQEILTQHRNEVGA